VLADLLGRAKRLDPQPLRVPANARSARRTLECGPIPSGRAGSGRVGAVVTLAAILGINAGLHLLGSAVTATYSPGAITGLIFYVPLAELGIVGPVFTYFGDDKDGKNRFLP